MLNSRCVQQSCKFTFKTFVKNLFAIYQENASKSDFIAGPQTESIQEKISYWLQRQKSQDDHY